MKAKSYMIQQPACLRISAAGFFLVLLLCLAGCGGATTPISANPTPTTPTSTQATAATNIPIPATATSITLSNPTSAPTAATTTGTPIPTVEAANTQPVAPTPSAAIVSIIDFDFSPKVITVTAGTKIVWINVGPTEHTVADNSLKIFSSDILNKGEGYVFTPTRPGKIEYLCTLHPDMVGAVIVK